MIKYCNIMISYWILPSIPYVLHTPLHGIHSTPHVLYTIGYMVLMVCMLLY